MSILHTKKNEINDNKRKENIIKSNINRKVIRKPNFLRILFVRIMAALLAATFLLAGIIYVRRYLFREWLMKEEEKYYEQVMDPSGNFRSYTEGIYQEGIKKAFEYIYSELPNSDKAFESLSDDEKKRLFKNELISLCSQPRYLNSEYFYVSLGKEEKDGRYFTVSEPDTLIFDRYVMGDINEPGISYICQDKAVIDAVENIVERINKTFEPVAVYFAVDEVYLKDDFTFVTDKIYVTYVIDDKYDPEKDECITLDLPSEEKMKEQGYTYLSLESKTYLSLYYTSFPKGVNSIPSLSSNHFQLLKWTTIERQADYELWVCSDYDIWNYYLDVVTQYKYLRLKADDGRSLWPDRYDLTNFEILRRDGIIIYVAAVVIALILSILVYMRQKSIYEIDTYRRELTNVMAHDLKTPLMVLRGNAENLVDIMNSEEEGDKQKAEKYAGNIMKNVDYMTGLINKTLTLSSLESGNGILEKQSIHVKELLEKLAESYEGAFKEREIKTEITGDDITVQADEFWLNEAFRNFFDNALKYAVQGSVLEVDIDKKRISFSNMAEGLSEDDIRKLANPFSKKDKARSGKKGSGIGLTIVKNIIELHGWKLDIKLQDDRFVVEVIL